MKIKFKRDMISVYFMIMFFAHFLKKEFASCIDIVGKIELLDAHISNGVSKWLYSFMKTKYNVSECSATDPFIVKTNERFAIERHKKFLISNTIVLKSYISPTEKGVILVKYTELFNILPFLFDLKRLQQRYHFILEPSSESPYHVYFKFFPTDSLVFIQSLSERESAMSITHGFIPLPVCAADWIMETNFVKMDNVKTKYDFAVIANFIPVKRHDYL